MRRINDDLLDLEEANFRAGQDEWARNAAEELEAQWHPADGDAEALMDSQDAWFLDNDGEPF